MAPLSPDDFYRQLRPFRRFEEFAEDRHYTPAPADWWVVLSDVRGSTQAIAEGRYKEVNTVGAATIAVLGERLRGEYPFVFGGDGATLLLPPSAMDAARTALGSLCALARANFGLELRVGVVAVRELLDSGHRLEVARHELPGGHAIAFFRGGGLAEAERRIKGDAARQLPMAPGGAPCELAGLSCRWQPIPSRRGRMVSLLVLARRQPQQVYPAVLACLRDLCGEAPDASHPVHAAGLHYRGWWSCLRDEWRYHRQHCSSAFLRRLVEISLAVLSLGHQVRLPGFAPDPYRNALAAHADYRKFDDMLRMVIDCGPREAAALRAALETRRLAGELFYGLRESDTALMTCLVEHVGDGGHVHFIDGGDGGYALAARELKAQVASTPA